MNKNTQTHIEKIAELRRLLRQHIPSISVRNAKGTAWGNAHIRGSGEFGVFSEPEKSELKRPGFNTGANCGIVFYEEIDRVIKRLQSK